MHQVVRTRGTRQDNECVGVWRREGGFKINVYIIGLVGFRGKGGFSPIRSGDEREAVNWSSKHVAPTALPA